MEQDEQLPSPKGMNELKRIFGHENVSEEKEVYPGTNIYGTGKPEWCYVVTINPDHKLLPSYPKSGMDFSFMIDDIDDVISDGLLLLPSMDTNVGGTEKASNRVEENDYRRLILPVNVIEEKTSVNFLSKLNTKDFVIDEDHKKTDRLKKWLRSASRGIRWKYIENNEGQFFETTTKLTRNPRELELAICKMLEVDDNVYLMPKKDGHARMPLNAILDGRIEHLPEFIAPKPHIKKIHVSKNIPDANLPEH